MEKDEIIKLAAQTAVENYKAEVSRLFNIKQAADLLAVSRSTIQRMVNSGKMAVTEVNGAKKFTMEAINACKKTW